MRGNKNKKEPGRNFKKLSMVLYEDQIETIDAFGLQESKSRNEVVRAAIDKVHKRKKRTKRTKNE